jgi:protein-S-isoprenylcysteine O-methyltransferase Ste14
MQTTTTKTVKRLTYRINGHLAFWVTLLLLNVGWPTWKNIVTPTSASVVVLSFGKAPLTWLYDHYTLLAFVTIIYALGLSTYLYIKSYSYEINSTTTGGKKKVPVLLATGGNSGNVIYDYFMGRELNPRSINGTFDWKEFCELRPGLIGWCILNMAMLSKQYNKLGYVTGSMILINIFQGLYVWDALYQERAILTTMDITTDGFGYMLIFGDLVWVPYTYSLQSRYLVDHDPYLSWYTLLCIVLVNIFGYCIFRGANGQKDTFRRNPESSEVSHLTYLQTKRGTKLLTSGYWGLARKINYTGDWIMGLSWCMVCGFDSIVPYYYAIYFAILLVHRSVRDDHMCQEKYGDDWDRYKEFVPYRFIPGII